MEKKCNIHIITVGTSILRNLENLYKECQEKQDKKCIDTLTEKVLVEPYTLSAELNALKEDLEKNQVTKTFLITSDTQEGLVTSNIIKNVLEKKWSIDSEIIKIKHLGLIFEEGVKNLLEEIGKIIHEAKKKNCKTHINLTGGFKPESAMAYLAACLLNADTVYYIHETMRTKSILPTIPIQFRKDVVELIEKIKNKETCIEWMTTIKWQEIDYLVDHGIAHREDGGCRLRKHALVLLELERER